MVNAFILLQQVCELVVQTSKEYRQLSAVALDLTTERSRRE